MAVGLGWVDENIPTGHRQLWLRYMSRSSPTNTRKLSTVSLDSKHYSRFQGSPHHAAGRKF